MKNSDLIPFIVKVYKYISTKVVEDISNRIQDILMKKRLITKKECTFESYEDAINIKYKGFELMKDYQTLSVPWLENIRKPFLDKLIEEIESYFPEYQVSIFEIFLPSRLPRNAGSSIRYGAREVITICEYLEWVNCNQLLQEWADLIDSIVTHENFCQLTQKNTKAFMFWSILLKLKTLSWTPLTRKLIIYTILVIPVGSAEAERGFSIMNHIRGDGRRSRLIPQHLEDILRIRINGPNNIEEFPAVKYAKAWVKNNHMLSNDPSIATRGHSKKDDKNEKLPYFPLY